MDVNIPVKDNLSGQFKWAVHSQPFCHVTIRSLVREQIFESILQEVAARIADDIWWLMHDISAYHLRRKLHEKEID